MTLDPPNERLRDALLELVALEGKVQRSANILQGEIDGVSAAHSLLTDLEEMAALHTGALQQRLQSEAVDRVMEHAALDLAPPASPTRERHRASMALATAYPIINEAMILYGLIEPIAHRARDSWVMADSGTTSHIARDHAQDYIAIAGRITAIIHDVVVAELEADDTFCGCTCPSCGVGICLCAVSSRWIIHEAATAALPPLATHGVAVMQPRPASAAAAAGFQRGDVIVAIDGQKVDAMMPLQRAIMEHQPGDRMELTVRRKAGEASVFVEHRREGVDINEDECLVPEGQDFRLDQARELQQKVREREGSNGSGLGRLSPRETQVLQLIAQGATNPVIAEELEIRRNTVDRHVSNILKKLGVANRTQAAGLATNDGLARAG